MLQPVFSEQIVRERIERLRADGAAARRSASPRRRPVGTWRRALGVRLVNAGFRLQGLGGR